MTPWWGHAFSAADGGHGAAVAEVQADEIGLGEGLVEECGGFLGDELVGSAVEAVFAQAVLHVPLVGHGVEEGLGRHGLVESGVEDGDLRGVREEFLGDVDAHEVGRIVQGAEGEEIADGGLDLGIHADGVAVDFTAVQDAVAHALDFGRVAEDALFGVGQQRDDAGHALVVGGEVFFFDELEFLAGGEFLVDDPALGRADLFDEAGGEEGAMVDVFEVHELVLDRGAAGVDDEDFHDGGFIACFQGKQKSRRFHVRLGGLGGPGLQRRFARGAAGVDAGAGRLAAPLLAGLLEMPLGADVAHDAFAVQLLFQAAQGLFDGLAFPDLHFCHGG